MPLADRSLLVFVGLTAVGKTTAVEGLLALRPDLRLLPNRRSIADQLILPRMLEELGEEIVAVSDRRRRFELTARYRRQFEGGLAHALSKLEMGTAPAREAYVFDGLRGIDEVRWASARMPRARFVVLDAPDSVRLRRLLGRGETFDRAAVRAVPDDGLQSSLGGLAGIGAVFSTSELQELARDRQISAHPVAAVVEKVAILIEERRNYDSRKAADFLENELEPKRSLRVDTSVLDPDRVASWIARWSASELD